MKNTLVLATGNAHKVQEIRAILAPHLDVEIKALSAFAGAPELQETAGTFEGNARQKALQCMEFTGLPSMADDSGLVIDALGGRPGIYSARYAPTPEERIGRVLREMEGIAEQQRAARFVAVMALALPGGACITREGRCEGRIALAPSGHGGFGYDPIFVIPALRKTLAEICEEEKNRLSHRGNALRQILPDLRRHLSPERGIAQK